MDQRYRSATRGQLVFLSVLAAIAALDIVAVTFSAAMGKFIQAVVGAAPLMALLPSLITISRRTFAGEVHPKSRRYWVTISTGLVLGFVVVPVVGLGVGIRSTMHQTGLTAMVIAMVIALVGACVFLYSFIVARRLEHRR